MIVNESFFKNVDNVENFTKTSWNKIKNIDNSNFNYNTKIITVNCGQNDFFFLKSNSKCIDHYFIHYVCYSM